MRKEYKINVFFNDEGEELEKLVEKLLIRQMKEGNVWLILMLGYI